MRRAGSVRLSRTRGSFDDRCAPVILNVNPFPITRHVSLHWSGGSRALKRRVEADLRTELRQLETQPHPVGFWLLWIAAGIYVGLFFVTLLYRVALPLWLGG
jgi:hypothetical protein